MSFREFILNLINEGRAGNVLFTLTPPAVREQKLGLRLLYAGGVLTAFGLSLFSAAASALLLILSLGVIYYLMSQVLELKVDFDPSMLFHSLQREKSAPSNSN